MDSGLLIGLVVAGILLIFAAMKKGSSDMKKPNKLKSFTTNAALDKSMKTIIQFAQNNKYKVDDFNESDAIIVLSDSASLTSYGNIYPIYLSRQSDDTIMIEVGIKSKSTQLIGLDAPHSRCFNGIKTAIYAIVTDISSDKVISTNTDSVNYLFCSNCGKPYFQIDNNKFCDSCGNKF